MFPEVDLKGFVQRIIIFGVVCLVVAFLLGFGVGRATAAELTGSQVLTIERSDHGELYAALSIVLDLAVTPDWSAVLIHDQAVTWEPGFAPFADRYAEWDASLAWRPAPEWSVSLGRRWRTAPAGSAGPWTYVQVWRGI